MENREKYSDVTGVILAGGPGSRMGGVQKALLDVGGLRCLERLVPVLENVFEKVMLSVRGGWDYLHLDLPLALDRIEVRSSLTGIHAALASAPTDHVFVCAGDAPFLRESLVRTLLSRVRPDRDVIIPVKEDGRMEPLCAIYSKRCLAPMEIQLMEGDCKIIRFFDQVSVHEVKPDAIRKADPEYLSFQNMNTPEDRKEMERLAASVSV